ncbi:alpha/beta hydrolase family protein [Thalassotalea profundi]|uniref:Peptidase n=1 Tax=Thalassotalea profundi TaxID=2036687 RepID=A0ABQ3IYD3_9GAMM|nr:prolyl oligopeptidase family serine peptidase [Thalassotalea profundi]GHE97311.1 peptidase [Thalassotalea profundi]
MKLVVLLSMLLLGQYVSVVNAATLFKDESNCFDGVTVSYDSWREFIRGKNSKGPNAEQREKMVMNWFDSKFSKSDFNRYLETLHCSNFTYEVDGKEVRGYYAHPKNVSGDLPVLIYNRGGNGNFSAVSFISQMKNIFPFASEGFVVIGTQYSGVAGGSKERTDEFGGKDVDDVISLLELLPFIAPADEARVGMYGASRGGMQSFLVLRALAETKKIKAIATIAAPTNLITNLKERPEMEEVYSKRIPNYALASVKQLKERSVVYWVDDLPKDVPVLLIHGAKDEKVSVRNATDLARLLENREHPYELEIYKEDGHIINVNEREMIHRVISWFKAKL